MTGEYDTDRGPEGMLEEGFEPLMLELELRIESRFETDAA